MNAYNSSKPRYYSLLYYFPEALHRYSSKYADALLYLSVISGKNPELLKIGYKTLLICARR